MNKGYILLFRQIQDCWIWDTGKFDKRSAWIDLLMLANHKEVKMLFDGNLIEVQRGQLITSINNLAKRWEWSKSTVFDFLNVLESDWMIKKQSDNHRTLLTIINYEVYQVFPNDSRTPTEHQPNTNRTPTETNNTLNTIYKRKDIPKGISKEKFVPPTVEEVAAYCCERGNYVDPEKFVDFYESKGWLVGKTKMKNWKACVRTWEKKDKEKGYIPKKNTPTDSKLMEYGRKIYQGDESRTAPYFGFPPEWFEGEQLVEGRITPLVCDKAYVQGGREDYTFTVEELKGLYESRKRGKKYEQCFDDIFDS